MTLYAVFFQPATGDADIDVPAQDFRLLLEALTGTGRKGVIAAESAVATQRGAGADFSVDVQPFHAICAGGDVADQGSYLIVNSAVTNIATPSAPSSGTRTHRLVAQIRDKRSNSAWSTYDAVLEVLEDTGGGEPATPASAMTLAHITIAAGQASVTNGDISQGYGLFRGLHAYGPWSSSQLGAGSWNHTASFNDYSAGSWPPVTFTVPPSGSVYVTIGGGLDVVSGQASLCWHITGADTRDYNWKTIFGAGSSGHHRGSRRTLVTGLTPGGLDTVTPAWYQSASGNSDLVEGTLIVEAVQ